MVFFKAGKWAKSCGLYFLLAILVVFALIACQKEEKQMIDPKAALTTTAETYWNKRLLEKDYNTTYTMEAAQGDMTVEQYKRRVANRGQIGYLSLKVKEVKITDQDGTIYLVVNCQLPNIPKSVDLSISDGWVRKGNEWKHVLSKKGFSPS